MKRALLMSGLTSAVMSALVAMLVVGIALPQATRAQNEEIRAGDVFIFGEEGVGSIRLRSGPGIAASVAVLDVNGIHRANLNTGGPASLGGTLPDASAVNLFAPDGARIGHLGTGGQGEEGRTINLILADRQERDRILLVVDQDGNPSISLLDAQGNVIWSAP